MKRSGFIEGNKRKPDFPDEIEVGDTVSYNEASGPLHVYYGKYEFMVITKFEDQIGVVPDSSMIMSPSNHFTLIRKAGR